MIGEILESINDAEMQASAIAKNADALISRIEIKNQTEIDKLRETAAKQLNEKIAAFKNEAEKEILQDLVAADCKLFVSPKQMEKAKDFIISSVLNMAEDRNGDMAANETSKKRSSTNRAKRNSANRDSHPSGDVATTSAASEERNSTNRTKRGEL